MRFIPEDNVLGERAMTRLSRLFVGTIAASLLANPISAQLLGGPIGGTLGRVTSTLGNTTGQLGSVPGNTLGGLGGMMFGSEA